MDANLSIEDKGMLCTKVISMERIESDFKWGEL